MAATPTAARTWMADGRRFAALAFARSRWSATDHSSAEAAGFCWAAVSDARGAPGASLPTSAGVWTMAAGAAWSTPGMTVPSVAPFNGDGAWATGLDESSDVDVSGATDTYVGGVAMLGFRL